MYSGNSLLTFGDKLSIPPSRVMKSLKGGAKRCHETSVRNYHSTLCNIPEEHKSHLHHGGRLKSHAEDEYCWNTLLTAYYIRLSKIHLKLNYL